MNDVNEAREFWERKILRWERSRYSRWTALYPLSWSIRSRLNQAADIIFERAQPDWRILELGCGSGHLAARLHPRFSSYAGVDLAKNAIEEACLRVPDYTFYAGDVLEAPLPPVELTVFLGLTDWLTPLRLQTLFERLESKYILFSYTNPSRWNPYRLYRRMMDPPTPPAEVLKARTYTDTEIDSMLAHAGYDGEILHGASLRNPGVLVWAERYA